MRMMMRRLTRLTNAVSKKVQYRIHAVALHFFPYNFIRKHSTIEKTPAQAAGVDKFQWTVEDLIDLVDAYAASSKR